MKGLVLLGRAGSGSDWKRFGEARRISWERLRDGVGGGGSSRVADGDGVENEDEEDELRDWRSDKTKDKDEGRVEEECTDRGTQGGECREEPLFRDWVVCLDDDEDENMLDVRESKGSGFHCASLWNPFSPLV